MAHPDLDRVLDALLPLAQQLLKRRGDFRPFGASVRADGEVAIDATMESDAEHTENVALAMAEQLSEALAAQAKRGAIRAAGICMDTRVRAPDSGEPVDAIFAHVEHVDGECLDVYLPYRKGWFGRVSFGGRNTSTGHPSLFAPAPADGAEGADPRSEERRRGGTAWDIELPPEWSFRDDAGHVTIAARPPCGTLTMSERGWPDDVTEDDALGHAGDDAPAPGDRRPVTLGEFSGFAWSGEVAGTWQRRWWVWCGRCLLCVTYGCSLTTKGLEDRGVNRILATLRAREPS